MNQHAPLHPLSPLLAFCPPTLPGQWYLDPVHFNRERAEIHGKNWIYAGRANDLPVLTLRRLEIAGQQLILLKDEKGEVACFHNTCRHRGAELCSQQEMKLKAKLVTCPYHGWAYDLAGRLLRTPYATEAPGFRKEDNDLFRAYVKQWNGFIFVCLAEAPPDFAAAPDLGAGALDRWPMADLVTGHRHTTVLNCNWKIFWENYNECLHCPGIHPSLCDMVPVYGQGIMAANEATDWTPEHEAAPALKPGARTWTQNGKPCGEEFPDLTEGERQRGYFFVTLMPTMYVVAHVDYVRAVSLRPLGPEETELTAEWLFPAETLTSPKFDLANVVEFAMTVMKEDGAACELNQRGIRSSRYAHGTLMPQEFDVYRFHQWVRQQLGEPLHQGSATA